MPEHDDKGGNKQPDLSGGLAKSFDQYEYVAVITPGATLLFGLLLIWPGNYSSQIGTDGGLATLGVFLIAAYVSGQILRAIGDVVERQLWNALRGMPSEWVLRTDARPLLDEAQRRTLRERAKNLCDADFSKLDIASTDSWSVRRDKQEQWQAITRKIYAKVKDAGKTSRIDVFNRTYGMMVGITVAAIIIALAALIQFKLGGFADCKLPAFASLAFIIACFTTYRAYIFGKLYARELLVTFIEVTNPERKSKSISKPAKSKA